MAAVRIGTSGWDYWNMWPGPPSAARQAPPFFPDSLPKNRAIDYLSRRLNAVELNASFYNLLAASTYANWHDKTPPDFRFAIKGSKFITHSKKLNDIKEPLATFFASGVLALGCKLGPLLWQFPEAMQWTPGMVERWRTFVALLPRTAGEALELARRHYSREHLKPGSKRTPYLQLGPGMEASTPLQHAIETRHSSFDCPEFRSLLAQHGAASVIPHSSGKFHDVYAPDCSPDFVYVRLHGRVRFCAGACRTTGCPGHLYLGKYTQAEIQTWAERMLRWWAGQADGDGSADGSGSAVTGIHGPRTVWVFFDNTDEGWAPHDALQLYHTATGSHFPSESEAMAQVAAVMAEEKASQRRQRASGAAASGSRRGRKRAASPVPEGSDEEEEEEQEEEDEDAVGESGEDVGAAEAAAVRGAGAGPSMLSNRARAGGSSSAAAVEYVVIDDDD